MFEIAYDHVINDGEGEDRNEENNDWVEGSHSTIISNYLVEQDFDDANEVQAR